MAVLTLGRVAVLAVIGAVGAGAGFHYTGRQVPWPLDRIPYGKLIPPYAEATQRPAQQGRQAAPQRPPVTIVTAKVERKPMPVRLDAIGTVQAISTVTVRSRVDTQITEVGFKDGGYVKKGDVLFRLDSRLVESLLRQAEANVARDKASLSSAESELRRAEELAKREFATDQRLDTARTQVATLKASIRGGEAFVDSLKVQLTYYTITAPVSGRIGVAGLKEGNIAKTGDNSTTLVTINQIDPIYVSFSLPQRHLPDIRAAMTSGTAVVLATQHGAPKGVEGKIAVIDNMVDATTGTIQMRAIFDNPEETLWPGALCQVRVTLRVDPEALTVPREAVQNGQNGTFVFVIEDGTARARPVTVDRTIDDRVVLSSGLKGDETVVIDGQLLLTDGARTVERNRGGQKPPGNLTSQRGSAG
ncbi:efflux RND transporter periplasmic adaptor subunit [Bosea caraganae]|uniref:Efflux RND transporter periplasmic adaptor subunit n=1 Tax=Bosea caraganae TaxID=2763117 RepID=A0A370LCK5_9HYPH|nr:efflux RND transporter periplasmic adaptor subunit [Bosea caraganae]RDJ27673.1 efflux RND transporter periplasmic adaptor subunit [Bosea caraganae]RDJ29686.1 efflux RND transporter periplasmic adaptor subunit [Bosea caraganae]